MEFNDFVNAVLHGGTITLSIFVLLVFLSIVTWAIIIGKSVQLRREDQNSGQFVKAFNKVKSLKSFVPANRKRAPVDYDLGIMFEELMDESQRFEEEFPEAKWRFTADKGLPEHLNEMLERTLDRVNLQMRERREQGLAYLATISNIAPFLGVLGTVIGIINAFTAIGKMGSAELAVVAPAISEALIATALGISVAIPASVGFNIFQYRVEILAQKFDRFSAILRNRLENELVSAHESSSDISHESF
ncbi:MAG: MotA/TolQ/ExbB proton channel family protein [SAR324 cluster bacterium]|nr:MotA/TolQ/ExbB proton channel family protein [SAR324 cluster bacterium]MEC9384345.1 MotA/TolQ/ExbB proton channel family protein [SAR324 cluster bacterium]MEC9460645.1 MotA/TolQ/ExbB proton channel family protein [SAR324 cluster bacterium]MED5434383.1 MotA/TolQ/ExbB proton channel family protein [SAR324 cluster bacterium]MED5483763.1 MotA/TolQ/ExbB proton channel family protein [SAR324 cluster bacterium]